MKAVLFFLLFIGISDLAIGQIVISGILTAKDGSAIPGCNVVIKGSSTSEVTQLCGEFTIEITDPKCILVFSCLSSRVWEIPSKKIKQGSVIVLTDWKAFENGSCKKDYKKQKRIKIY